MIMGIWDCKLQLMKIKKRAPLYEICDVPVLDFFFRDFCDLTSNLKEQEVTWRLEIQVLTLEDDVGAIS